jgi:phosphomethylpyrimidine synthase
MKITQDVRDYAAAQGLAEDQAIAAGLAEKAAEFKRAGEHLYVQEAGVGAASSADVGPVG